MENCTYSPQISPGNSNITPMPADLPYTPVARPTILLEYPYAAPTLTLELRTPEFNDIGLLEFSRVQKRSRGNTLILYRDPIWPKSKTFNFSIRALTQVSRDEIIAFCRASIGQWVKFTDWRSQEHKVIILNPSNSITQEGRGCQFTWKVDLQEITNG